MLILHGIYDHGKIDINEKELPDIKTEVEIKLLESFKFNINFEIKLSENFKLNINFEIKLSENFKFNINFEIKLNK